MTRAEFIDYFEAVWTGNWGLPHNSKENLDTCWEICLNAMSDDGEEVDWNWSPTKEEIKKYKAYPDFNA